MIRSLRVVRRPATAITPVQFTSPSPRKAPTSSSRVASCPVMPTISTPTPRLARLAATLAAPPGTERSAVTRITGTGASGEMRFTSPVM